MIYNYPIQSMATSYQIYRTLPSRDAPVRAHLLAQMKKCSGRKRLRKKVAQRLLRVQWWARCSQLL